jgi:hypothetical protein
MSVRLITGVVCCVGVLSQSVVSLAASRGGLAPLLVYQMEQEQQYANQGGEVGRIEVSTIIAHGVDTVMTDYYSYPVYFQGSPSNPASQRATQYVADRVPELGASAGAAAGGYAFGVWAAGGTFLGGEIGTAVAVGAMAGGFVGLALGVAVGAY